MSNPNSETVSIGTFAKRCGVSIDTLRFYEKKGLITPQRDVNNRRRYLPADAERVALIHRLQNGGFTIAEIREDVDLRGDGSTNVAARHALLTRKLTEVYKRQAALQDSINYLEDKIAWLAGKMP